MNSKVHIVFYDVTDTDLEQFKLQLDESRFSVTLIKEPLTDGNVDPTADVVSIFVSSNVTAEHIAAMPQLQLVACRSTGFNNVNLDAAFERSIAVVNVPSYGSSTVAEYTFALLLSLSRKLIEANSRTREGELQHDQLRGTDLRGKTIGIIGTGKIGLKVAHIAHAFGMQIRGYDPYPNRSEANKVDMTYSSLGELVEYSDVISLHAPYTADAYHLIGEALLNKCKTGAILINTARGELVDTRAVLEALESGKLAAAGLDVLEDEQLLDHHEEMLLLRAHHADQSELEHSLEIMALQKMDNVIITRHNAFNTIEAVSRINQTTLENINNYFADGISQNRVATRRGMLVVVRHTESEWNAMSKWTGTTDVSLTTKGLQEAAEMGQLLRDVRFDEVFVSEQVRTHQTAEQLLTAAGSTVSFTEAAELNERDYGVYTGKDKWEIKEQLGDDVFNAIRRGWDNPIENGESLKQVFRRAVPYYRDTIAPMINQGKNVLIVGHGNSIRSLVKYIEDISDEDIETTEMIFGTALIYAVDAEGRMSNRQLRSIDSTPPPA